MAMNIDPETRERSHALNAYYEPNKARENLIVVTGALVTNLHFSDSKDEKGNAGATGISYTQSHGSYSHSLIATATASKEIILAAGALQTPKLLELSGVGSEGLLRELDIPIVVSNENIGENLQDHTNCGFSFEVAEGIKTMDDLARQKLEAIEAAMGEYATEKKEPFATGGKFAGGILPVVKFLGEDGKVEELKGKYRDDDGRPFMKDHTELVRRLLRTPTEASGGFFSYAALGNFIPETGAGDIIGKENSNPSHKASDVSPGNYFTIACMLLHPLSRGNTHITSNSPHHTPQDRP